MAWAAGPAGAAAEQAALPWPGLLNCRRYGDTNELWNSLDGIFACVIWDERTGTFCAARDPIGICSLYWGRADDGSVWFASEMKALQEHCKTIDCFPPVGAGAGRGLQAPGCWGRWQWAVGSVLPPPLPS